MVLDVEALAEVLPDLWRVDPAEVPPLLFTPERAGELLGVSRDKVYLLIQQRELRSVKVGRSRRISARALSEYVEHLELGEPA